MENENSAEVISLNDLLPTNIGEEENNSSEDASEITLQPKADFFADTFGIPTVDDIVDEETRAEDNPPNEEVEITLENNTGTVDFRAALKNVFGNTVQTLAIAEEDGTEKEVSIDDLDINQELFETILQGRIEQIKQEESQDKVSVKGVSDFTKSLIDIDKRGGNIRELLEVKDAYLDPLNEIDLSTIDGQRQAVYLRMRASNTPEQDIQLLIESYEAKGILPEKAVQSESELRAAINSQVELKKQKALEEETVRKEMMKNFRKEVKDSFTDFKLSDSVKNKLTDLTTKETDIGRFQLDDLYSEARRDPKRAAQLALFLYDQNEYNSQISEKKVLEKQLDTASKLRITPRSGTASADYGKPHAKDSVPLAAFNP